MHGIEVNKLDSVLSKAVIDNGNVCELTVVIQVLISLVEYLSTGQSKAIITHSQLLTRGEQL